MIAINCYWPVLLSKLAIDNFKIRAMADKNKRSLIAFTSALAAVSPGYGS
jgi:hypothetical protein